MWTRRHSAAIRPRANTDTGTANAIASTDQGEVRREVQRCVRNLPPTFQQQILVGNVRFDPRTVFIRTQSCPELMKLIELLACRFSATLACLYLLRSMQDELLAAEVFTGASILQFDRSESMHHIAQLVALNMDYMRLA